MNQAHKDAINPMKQFTDEIERIEQLPQIQRWRAIKRLLFKMRPEFIAVDKQFCAEVKEERDSQLNDLGASKSLSTRHLYSMPQYLYALITVIDPEFTRLNEDKNESKKLHLKVARAFPEYCVATKI